jgi:hypothetical protein
MAGFSSGPWYTAHMGSEMVDASGRVLATLSARKLESFEEMEANARLMAKSPDMYDIMHDIQEMINRMQTGSLVLEDELSSISSRIEGVRKAIEEC